MEGGSSPSGHSNLDSGTEVDFEPSGQDKNMPLSAYTNTPVDVSVAPDIKMLRDKSVIITGGGTVLLFLCGGHKTDPVLSTGASGFGENHARAFVAAG